jgi:hypothetical protein
MGMSCLQRCWRPTGFGACQNHAALAATVVATAGDGWACHAACSTLEAAAAMSLDGAPFSIECLRMLHCCDLGRESNPAVTPTSAAL